MASPFCFRCREHSVLVAGVSLYWSRPHLWHKLTWLCSTCGARVGCHPGTDKPLGTLADEALRQKRADAHDAFDALWKSGEMTRGAAYRWLREVLNVAKEEAHIGMLNENQCAALIRAVKEKADAKSDARGL